jgi:hypothetical protein
LAVCSAGAQTNVHVHFERERERERERTTDSLLFARAPKQMYTLRETERERES